MSRPKTPIEKNLESIHNKLARIELRQDRMERAIGALTVGKSREEIAKILRGEN